jgi:hypothetical protein
MESGLSDLNRLESMVLRDNSKASFVSKANISQAWNEVVRQESNFSNYEPDKVYLENINNQPSQKVFQKRKVAAQYVPYGVFAKQSGGFSKASSKFYVRGDLMFYSKYDKRLIAELTKAEKASKKSLSLPKGQKVIVLGEDKGQVLACPLNNDVIYKNSIPIEVISLGKLSKLVVTKLRKLYFNFFCQIFLIFNVFAYFCLTVRFTLDPKHLRPSFADYPCAKRYYEIEGWYNFAENDLLATEETTTVQVDISMMKSDKVTPVGIAIATKDFNLKNQEKEPKTNGDLNFLAFVKDDLVIMTQKCNKSGWFEGYRARDNSCIAGISHIDFIKIIF